MLLQAAWRVTGRGGIPALSWFGFSPEIALHKMVKEVLEYLSKQRLRIVFVHFQQLPPVCAARPRCQLRSGGASAFNSIRGEAVRQDPSPNVCCSLFIL